MGIILIKKNKNKKTKKNKNKKTTNKQINKQTKNNNKKAKLITWIHIPQILNKYSYFCEKGKKKEKNITIRVSKNMHGHGYPIDHTYCRRPCIPRL